MTNSRLQWKPLAVVGLISGLIQVAAGVTMYLAGVYFASWSGLVSLVVLAVCIVTGTLWYRRHVLGGSSTYWKALLIGIVIGVCTGLVYITYNIVSVSFVYPHFLEDMVQARFAYQQSVGMNPSQALHVLEGLRKETTLRMIVASNFTGFCLFGTVLSALTAIVFRMRKQIVEV